ncbi:MAG TPA: fumarylacetoacetate hydrolase family protein [Acidimicrobiales bacterium]|jgi:2-keto-4-pentenoate hydratase/2-oxohepta-3-ene-1,7-dioic acid hydratase in catechol pathway
MRLARFTHEGSTGLGVVLGEPEAGAAILDLRAAAPELGDDLREILATGGPDWPAIRAAVDRPATRVEIPLAEVRLEAPIPRPPSFFAIGLNYADHLAETGRERSDFPVFFTKAPTCVTGPVDPIHVPRASPLVDYEGELGVLIGRLCRHVPAEEVHRVIAGYFVVDDVSVRDWQARSPTMILGKGWDTHGPTGPWITTADEVSDPQALAIRTTVAGELLQDGSTADMLWSVAEQIAILSTVSTLEPGTLLATGTPAGVGIARNPARLLKAGDEVRVEIGHLGALTNPVIDEPDDTPRW